MGWHTVGARWPRRSIGTMQTVVQTNGLTKSYKNVRALDGIDLEVDSGEIFGLVGPEGSGRTTFVRILMGLLRPTSGRARVVGYNATEAAYQAHRLVGYVPHRPVLPPRLTTGEFLDRVASFRRTEVDTAWRRELIGLLELDTTERLGELSDPEILAVTLVSVLQKDPDLLIVDDLVESMGPLAWALPTIFGAQQSRGGAVLFTSGRFDECTELADRVALIDRGRLVAVDSLRNLRKKGRHRIELVFSRPVDQSVLASAPGVLGAMVQGTVGRVLVAGPVEPLLDVAHDHGVVDVVHHRSGPEELILDLAAQPRVAS
ncbi:MAG TPA: ABC transporter ATP-binding protein [Acidimicrobiales bacterium]|nr:ABC transporter ATP-binding protein [Acidimicrobiales bacterium]